MAPGEKGFILREVCRIKHESINKSINDMKEDIEEIIKEENKQYEEIKKMITNLTHEVKYSHQNLKDKIILSEKSTGDKIDSLNEFDESLKGNGDPGVWESVRNIKRNIKIMMITIIIILILMLGGNYRGVTVKSIRERLGLTNKQQIKQVDSAPDPATILKK